MAIIFPGVNPAVQTQSLKVPPRKIAANLLNPPSQRPTSIMCAFDWAGDYGVTAASPSANVLVNIDAGGAQQPIDIIRSVKIDNTGNPAPAYVYFLDSTDAIVAPPNTIVWEPVVTNNRQANVILLGGTNSVGFTKVYFCNFFVPPYVNAEIAQAVELRLASPQIIFGGLTLAGGTVVQSGQSYTAGGLNVTGGGGGAGAAAHGLLDQFGRFTGVVIDNPGANYRSAVTLTPNAGHAARPAWVQTTSYATGSIVTFNGTEWIRGGGAVVGLFTPWNSGSTYNTGNQVSVGNTNYQAKFDIGPGVNPATNPGSWTQLNTVLAPNLDSGWTNSGSAGGSAASFSVTMNVGAGEIIQNPTYAPAALGDTRADYFNTIAVAGVFQDNLWGSPYTSGFLYITHENVLAVTFATAGTPFIAWQIESLDGLVFAKFGFGNFSSAAIPLLVSNLNDTNFKLDATKQWRLNLTSMAGSTSVTLNHRWGYTYALK